MKILFSALLTLLFTQTGLADLQQQWVVAKYQTPEDRQDAEFEHLTGQAEAAVVGRPGHTEPLRLTLHPDNRTLHPVQPPVSG